MARYSDLVESAEKIFGSSSAPAILIASSGEVAWSNEALERFAGWRPADLKGRAGIPFLSTEQEAKFRDAIRRAPLEGPPEPFDAAVACRDGAVRDVRWNAMLLRDEGEPGRYSVVFLGNESRKRVQGKADPGRVEDRYRITFENSPIGMMYNDENMLLTLVNREFEHLTGYSKAETEGRMRGTDLVAGEAERARILEFHRLRRISPELAPEMYNTRFRDGDVRDVTLRVSMIPGTTHSLVAFFDITGKRRAEEALRESEEKYRTLVENLQDSLYRADLEGRFTYISPSGARLLGYDSPDDLVGKNIPQTIYLDPGKRTAMLDRMFREGNVTNYEVALKRRDGSRVDVMLNGHVFRDRDGNVAGVEGIFRDITEQKRMAAEVNRLATLVRNTGEMVMLTDNEGNVIYLNDAGARLLGVDPGEIGKLRALETIAAPMRRLVADKLLPQILSGGSWEGELQYLNRKTGSVVDAHTLIFTMDDPDNPQKKIFANLSIDITQRKRSEKILRENEERLRAITNNVPGTLFRCLVQENGGFGLTFVSERFVRELRLPEEPEARFRTFVSLLHEEDRDGFMDSVRKAAETGSPWSFEGRFVGPSGGTTWFHGMATPTRHGDTLAYDGILLDVTERKLAEERLRHSEEKFSKIFMTTPDFICISRLKDGRFLDVNRGFEDITGWKADEVLGRTSLELEFWADPSEREIMVEDLKAGVNIMQREFRFRGKDGRIRSGTYSARPVNIAGEECLVFVMQDITELKRLAEERLKLERQLLQSQKMDAIGKLAGGVAHDFNNILTGILGNASLMLMECGPGHPHFKRLTQIEEHVKRGANLTRQLLGFAREGKYEVRTLSVNDLVRKNAQMFLEARKEIEGQLDLPDGIRPVDADAGQIEQVLLNICINAAHAMPGGGTLRIQTANVTLGEAEAKASGAKPGEYVRISITDTGTGMDRETLSKIFDPFFTTKAAEGGTGLGLASAYGIVRNHGGFINAYSEPGHGSTFNICLPASGKAPDAEPAGKPEAGLRRGSGGILLVDDEPMILDAASGLLKSLGYTVHRAASGQEAAAVYREKRAEIDLVILDMILPGMSGAQVIRMLREIDPGVKVILSSGYGLQGEVQKVMEMGCLAFVQKPFNFPNLSEIVHRTLNSPPEAGTP
jgi:PAS domain S-box-containing protein